MPGPAHSLMHQQLNGIFKWKNVVAGLTFFGGKKGGFWFRTLRNTVQSFDQVQRGSKEDPGRKRYKSFKWWDKFFVLQIFSKNPRLQRNCTWYLTLKFSIEAQLSCYLIFRKVEIIFGLIFGRSSLNSQRVP